MEGVGIVRRGRERRGGVERRRVGLVRDSKDEDRGLFYTRGCMGDVRGSVLIISSVGLRFLAGGWIGQATAAEGPLGRDRL